MTLESIFRFSQSNLSAYLSCPRRFYLRYVQRLDWPAMISEPVLERENHLKNGSHFHVLVQQYNAGMPVEDISRTIQDANLDRWWQNFLDFYPKAGLEGKLLAEYTLTTQAAGFHLDAKYDLLNIQPDNTITIFDWKTNNRLPDPARLEDSIQTKVYRYVLSSAGGSLLEEGPLQPEKIRMVYWFVEFPENPIIFQYTTAAMRKDLNELEILIKEISSCDEDLFSKTEEIRNCRLCEYRSYCERGEKAGDWDDESESLTKSEDLFENLDFDQIGEIAF